MTKTIGEIERKAECARKYRKNNPWMKHYAKARWEGTLKDGNGTRYEYYGGRGIKFILSIPEIKQLWLRDNADTLSQPSIDRIDNKGNYEFSNCRFIEKSENSRRARGHIASNRIPVEQLTLSGRWVKSFCSISHAAEETMASKTQISRCILNPLKTSSGGFRWARKTLYKA